MEMGRISFLTPAGAGREATRRRALTMPLGSFECVGDIRAGRDIYTMKELRATSVFHDIRSNPVKGAIALFIAEVLSVVLRENQEDLVLFTFLNYAIKRLNDTDSSKASNFHICFLYKLGRYIGIEPDVSTYREGRIFDMLDGTFRTTAPLHNNYLKREAATVVAALSRMTFDNMHHFRFTRGERHDLLDNILRYYTIHYATLSSLRSIDVLRALFD